MLERRIELLEQRWRQVIQRAIVIAGDPETVGPYTVAIQDSYNGSTIYITDVLYRPFLTSVIFSVTLPNDASVEAVETDGEFTINVPVHPEIDNIASSIADGHRHNTDVPERTHMPVKVEAILPNPEVDDRVLIWSPTGEPAVVSFIIGKY